MRVSGHQVTSEHERVISGHMTFRDTSGERRVDSFYKTRMKRLARSIFVFGDEIMNNFRELLDLGGVF